jgi:TPR repeat protein
MSVWALFFAAMTATGRTDGRHTGDVLPFWQLACAADRPTACKRLVSLEWTYCSDNSGWACNELGVQYREGELAPADPDRSFTLLSKACELRFQAACLNLLEPSSVVRAPPRVLDLRLLLREGGRNLMEMSEPELYARACEHRWMHACRGVAVAS